MKLWELSEQIHDLIIAGHSNKEVFYRHGSSGDCGEVGNMYVTSETNECGPFDLKDGEEYIKLHIGY